MKQARNSLDDARHEFEEWRERRTLGTRIPETLWDLAVVAAREHGLSKASGELGLDYYKLKELVQPVAALVAAPEASERPAGADFLELGLLATPASECVFEIEDGEGRRLRAVLTGSAPAELATLARTFWSLAR
jgi:hypothetical protein